MNTQKRFNATTYALVGSILTTIWLFADEANRSESTVVIDIPKVRTPSCTIVPQPPKVIVNGGSDTKLRKIHFSKRYPPGYQPLEERIAKRFAKKSTGDDKVGQINAGRIAAYVTADMHTSVEKVRKRLSDAGFKVLGTMALTKKNQHNIVVFTDNALSRFATEHGVEFLADLHLDVDLEHKRITITNPLYLAKAYMGEKFDPSVPKATLEKLIKTFHGLKNGNDQIKFEALTHYKFMNGMPEYKDMVEIALGEDWDEEKLKTDNRIVYLHSLSNGSIVAAISLSHRIQTFPYRIGTNNAALLPYPVLIKDKKITMMDPKYYIALMYPQLQMSQFMTIANIPDAIVKEARHIFR